jgi:hypothetical protein
MFERRILEADSETQVQYRSVVNGLFEKLPPLTGIGQDIGVYFNDELVGGFTLTQKMNLAEDPDLRRDWIVSANQQGVRLQRLWTRQGGPKGKLKWVFSAVAETVETDQFMYGIISLPLAFAGRHHDVFARHQAWLMPRHPLESCEWHEEARPSSDGKMLLKFYLGNGALLLGAPSGNQLDASVRIALGIQMSSKIKELYAGTTCDA